MTTKEIRFQYSDDALCVARYESSDRALDVTWPGLLVDASQYPADKWSTYGAYGDEHAVYLALAWRLRENLTTFVIPSYYGRRAAALSGKQPTKVRWDYEIDTGETPSADRGFERGRTAEKVGTGFWHPSTTGKYALMFEVDGWLELVALQRGTRGDASGQVTIFALDAGRDEDLRTFLNSRVRPDLEAFLRPGERFIAVCVGEDLGYDNCVLVKSKDDLRPACDDAAASVNAQVAKYQEHAVDITTIDEFIERVTGFALA